MKVPDLQYDQLAPDLRLRYDQGSAIGVTGWIYQKGFEPYRNPNLQSEQGALQLSQAPHNLEIERGLLGALLCSNDLFPLVSEALQPEHFFERVHSRIYETASTLCRDGKTASPITLKTYFEDDATLSEIGGAGYLANLAANACVPASALEYAQILRDLAARRAVIEQCDDLSALARDMDAQAPIEADIAETVTRFSELIEGDAVKRKTSFTVGEAAAQSIERIARLYEGGTDYNAIPTGIASYDEMTGGLHRGEYVVLGARPSMGKTALAVQIAMNVCQAGHGVLYLSLEMPNALLMPRVLASQVWTSETPVDFARIGRGALSEQELRWVTQAAGETSDWPLVLDEAPALSPSEVETKARLVQSRFQRQGKSLDLIICDHLHKMREPRCTSKVAEYTEISARLAEIAKRLDCPVLALAQLNRGVEARDDKRPTLADIRESGSIEQDADTVLFAYRDSYYLERMRPKNIEDEADIRAELSECANDIELIIAKQRSGPTGTAMAWCDLSCNVVRSDQDAVHFEQKEIAA